MNKYELSFTIHGLPKMANTWGRSQHFVRHRHDSSWHRMVMLAVGARRPKSPLKLYSLTLIRYSSKEPDYDGLVLSFKTIIDGLRHAAVLEDDKLSNSGSWNVRWEKTNPKAG